MMGFFSEMPHTGFDRITAPKPAKGHEKKVFPLLSLKFRGAEIGNGFATESSRKN